MEWLIWAVAGVAGAWALTALVRALERCYDY